MKNIELYNKTCDILYQAYFNDTLKFGDMCYCAVGNIIRGNGLEPQKHSTHYSGWYKLVDNFEDAETLAFNEVAVTGYSVEDIVSIERAFENAGKWDGSDRNTPENMFNGLVAVLEALKQIHEAEPDEQVQRFTQIYRSKVPA